MNWKKDLGEARGLLCILSGSFEEVSLWRDIDIEMLLAANPGASVGKLSLSTVWKDSHPFELDTWDISTVTGIHWIASIQLRMIVTLHKVINTWTIRSAQWSAHCVDLNTRQTPLGPWHNERHGHDKLYTLLDCFCFFTLLWRIQDQM